ncbi:MAG: nickel-dependent hydrogenase large subunit [Carboxydocellales bacterium]
MTKLVLAPISRISGQLKIELEIEGGKVLQTKVGGTTVRGIEKMLKGHDPRDAQLLTQRICGICPVGHGVAATQALEKACDTVIPENARVIRNLLLGANFLYTNINHFYQIAAPDYFQNLPLAPYIPGPTIIPPLPTQVNSALSQHFFLSLEVGRTIQEMVAVFGGKMPHPAALVPGGVTENVDAQKVTAFYSRLMKVEEFIRNIYIPDVQTLAQYNPQEWTYGAGTSNFLSLGAFPLQKKVQGLQNLFLYSGRYINGQLAEADAEKIKEDSRYAWYEEDTFGIEKAGAYSWVKAPRYEGQVYEVGALARMLIQENAVVKALGRKAFSNMGRHMARAEESRLLAEALKGWLNELEPGKPVSTKLNLKPLTQGAGEIEAPQGAMIHRLEVKNGVIHNYQIIAPATWNASPRDDQGKPGALEQALIGTPVADINNPLEVYRVIRSFDLCLSCASH